MRNTYKYSRIYSGLNLEFYEGTKAWAQSSYFREYAPDFINDILKGIKYKKTEWNKINHVQYKIIEDKY